LSLYSHNETSLVMSTLAIWCRLVRSRDVRSRDFSAPVRLSTRNVEKRIQNLQGKSTVCN